MVPLCGAGRTDNRGRQPPQGKSASARSPRQGSDKTARPATIFTHNGAPAGAGWLITAIYLPDIDPVIVRPQWVGFSVKRLKLKVFSSARWQKLRDAVRSLPVRG